nr:barstar family protein [Bradyrhizobium sp. BRP56]
MATLAAQLEFPGYFGSNWDGFEECIRGRGCRTVPCL